MDEISRIETLFLFYSKTIDNPRTKISEFHKLQSLYKNPNSTSKLIQNAFEEKIIVGPFIYCNSGIEVRFSNQEEVTDPINQLIMCKKNPKITRAVVLFGEYSFLRFRKGVSELTYAEAIIPTLNSAFSIENIKLEKKGKLPKDQYPRCWDDLDWEIYHMMRNPRISFARISGKIKNKFDVSWKTIEIRFNKILKDCKIMSGFFPNGMDSYSQTFLTLKTEYETDLRNELKKLNRSTYIYKMRDTILLNLFLDHNIDHRIFIKLKKKGLIQDLHVSIPLYFWTPFPV